MLWHMAYRILIPRPGMDLRTPAVEALSPNHWTTREVPENILKQCEKCWHPFITSLIQSHNEWSHITSLIQSLYTRAEAAMSTSTGRLSESHVQGDNSADYPLGLFFFFFNITIKLGFQSALDASHEKFLSCSINISLCSQTHRLLKPVLHTCFPIHSVGDLAGNNIFWKSHKTETAFLMRRQ